MQFLVIIEYPGLLPFIEEWGAADEASLRELLTSYLDRPKPPKSIKYVPLAEVRSL